MKKLLTLLIVSACVVFLASCGGGASTPEEVSVKFAKALDNMDIDAAKAVSTEKSKKALDMIKSMAQQAKGKSGKGKYEKATCADAGTDKKLCKVCCGEGAGSEMPVTVVKENGKWLVDMSKEELTKKNNSDKGGNDMPDVKEGDAPADPAKTDEKKGE